MTDSRRWVSAVAGTVLFLAASAAMTPASPAPEGSAAPAGRGGAATRPRAEAPKDLIVELQPGQGAFRGQVYTDANLLVAAVSDAALDPLQDVVLSVQGETPWQEVVAIRNLLAKADVTRILIRERGGPPATGPASQPSPQPATQPATRPAGKPVIELWDGGVYLMNVKPYFLFAAWENGTVVRRKTWFDTDIEKRQKSALEFVRVEPNVVAGMVEEMVKAGFLKPSRDHGVVFPDGPAWKLAVRRRGQERILDCDSRQDWQPYLKSMGAIDTPERQKTEAFVKMWGECIQVLARFSADGWRPWTGKPPLEAPPQPGDAASRPASQPASSPATLPHAGAQGAADVGEFCIYGQVRRPGVYALTGRNITLKMALTAAGNLNSDAWPEQCHLLRVDANGTEAVTSVSPEAVFQGKQPDVVLRKDDLICVGVDPNSVPPPRTREAWTRAATRAATQPASRPARDW
jgi:hypothetical protein